MTRSLALRTLLVVLLSARFAIGDDSASIVMPLSGIDGWPGLLILIGGGDVPEDAISALKKSVNDGESLVVIADAAADPGAAAESARVWLADHGISGVVTIDSSLETSERWSNTEHAIDEAAGVWICGGQQKTLAEAYVGSGVESALQRLLQRGGTVAGTSAGAAIMSKVMIASGTDQPDMSEGWDLLRGAIVDQHFTQRSRLARSKIAVGMHPECFGIGIDETTAVFVKGRQIRVAGSGTASIILAKANYRDEEVIALAADATADLTQLRRSARTRSAGIDPGTPQFGSPRVASGSLVIVGGGAMMDDVVDRFVELAGGETAHIVVLPTAVSREATSLQVPGFLRRENTASITVLSQRGHDEVTSDEFRTALKSATGIWFGGGRQWNFVDAYEGTAALEMFHDVLRRGGVIGGSSAGATIQGEFLVRGHPLGNTVMMAEGYERGFAYLPGAAIDQHFSQRGRQPDLLPVIRRHPKMLGIGLDEGTAIVVTGTLVEVLGQHSAHFVSANQLATIAPDQPLPEVADEAAKLYLSVKSGESIDLTTIFE